MQDLIRTPQDLPHVGTTYETSRLDFKRSVGDDRTELAKDVAAFANSVGGAIVVGACAAGERLEAYAPLPAECAASVREAYDLAVRDLCLPKPLVEANPIQLPDGIGLAVNVWPFPAQPVGVAVGARSAATAKHFWFPYRSGTHTVDLKPDQLPMLMLPDVRRVAILLSSIPVEERNSVTLLVAEGHRKDSLTKKDVRLHLNLHDVTMKNTVRFETIGGDTQFTVPADSITHVWESVSEGWFVSTSVRLTTDGGVLQAMP